MSVHVFSRRFMSRTGMSQDELERRKLFAEILEYEQESVSAHKIKINHNIEVGFQNEHGSYIPIYSN